MKSVEGGVWKDQPGNTLSHKAAFRQAFCTARPFTTPNFMAGLAVKLDRAYHNQNNDLEISQTVVLISPPRHRIVGQWPLTRTKRTSFKIN